jgi:hypothetical protein
MTVVLVRACMRAWKDRVTLVRRNEAEDGEIWWFRTGLREWSVSSMRVMQGGGRVGRSLMFLMGSGHQMVLYESRVLVVGARDIKHPVYPYFCEHWATSREHLTLPW